MNQIVSVIVPTYNEERDILDCILSLKKQSHSPLEIIVIDDGSTDNTRKIVKGQKIKLLTQLHQGPGPARNLGAKHAKGEILVFVDSDMTFDPDFVQKIIHPIKNKKSVGTFTTQEFVSNWNNSWSRCWNYNNGNKTNKRVRDTKHDHEDYRAILSTEFKKSGGYDPIGYTDSRTLVSKIGPPSLVTDAICYHKNPSSVKEVFIQARWIGKRKMRYGILGKLMNIIRYSLPLSILNGIFGSFIYKEPKFIIFKIIYDLGFVVGIISNLFLKNSSR